MSGEAHGYHLTTSGEPEGDETFLAILNAHPESVPFTLPPERFGKSWACILETASEGSPQPRTSGAGETHHVGGGALVLLRRLDDSLPARKLERW